MRIAFCADGGAAAGLGHLGRCSALAQAFIALGHDVVFLDVSRECRSWLKRKGLRTEATGTRRRDLIVADSYRLSPAKYAALNRLAGTFVVIDDFGTYAGPCDWVLNGHPYARDLSFRAPRAASLLLGPKFLPLRAEYRTRGRARATRPRIRRVLVTLGGGKNGALDAAVAAIRSVLPKADIHAVVGPFSRPPAAGGRLTLHLSPESLRPLLEAADVVVCAGGQTLYEAAFTGTPALALELGPDQRGNLASLGEEGVILRLGKADRAFPARLAKALRALDAAPERRARMTAAGRAMIDGRGAARVAAALAAAKRRS